MDASNRTARLTANAAAAAAPTRPQQSANSPAASLPTETLRKILLHTVEDMDAFEAQAARLAFGKVAALWWLVAEVDKHAAVRNSFQAEELAAVLKEREKKVIVLDVVVEPSGAGTGERVAALVNACPELQILRLDLHSRLGGTSGDYLGRPIHQAMRTLSELVDLKVLGWLSQSPFNLHDLLNGLPRLRAFRAPRLFVWQLSAPTPTPSVLPSLTTLYLPSPCRDNRGALSSILEAASRTVKHVQMVYPDPRTTSDDWAPLLTVAPRLRSLHFDNALDPETLRDQCLDAVLAALSEVENLSIGLDGHDTSKLFGCLGRLVHLRTCTIHGNDLAFKSKLEDLVAADAVVYLEKGCRLRSLTLPSRLCEVWTAEEISRVEEAAKEAGVWFKLA